MLRLRSDANFARRNFVRLPVLVVAYVALWLTSELVAFEFIVYLIGFTGAILACIVTSFMGFASLRRIGASAALRLRHAVARRGSDYSGLSRDALLDGALAGLGAVLLILPGFVSDFVGLALAAPSFRSGIADRLKIGGLGKLGNGRPPAPAVIDLAPEEWAREDRLGTGH